MPASQINIKVIGEGKPFVFQHGLGANIEQVEQLVSGIDGIQWIFMDMPGHGQSELTADAIPSFDFYTDQLVLALDKLGIQKAHFGGISMGAGIAINMALRYPEKVEGLFLVRPAWIDQETPEHLKILVQAANLLGQTNGIELFKNESSFEEINNKLPNAGQSLLSLFSAEQQKELPKVLEAMVNDKPYSSTEALQKLNLPCIIIGNDDDPLHPYEIAEKTNQNIVGSTIHKVTSRYIDGELHQKEIIELINKYLQNI